MGEWSAFGTCTTKWAQGVKTPFSPFCLIWACHSLCERNVDVLDMGTHLHHQIGTQETSLYCLPQMMKITTLSWVLPPTVLFKSNQIVWTFPKKQRYLSSISLANIIFGLTIGGVGYCYWLQITNFPSALSWEWKRLLLESPLYFCHIARHYYSVWLDNLLAFSQNVHPSPEKPPLSLQHSVEQENSFYGKNTRSSLLSGKKVLCQVSSLKVFSVVTVNPLELNSMPHNLSAAIPSISDLDVSGSCFLNKIDLEEQDSQHRKNIRSSNWNENEVLHLVFY